MTLPLSPQGSPATVDQPNDTAASTRNSFTAPPCPEAEELSEAETSQHLERLRAAVHSQDSSVYARLDRNTGSRPRLLIGNGVRRVVTVTPPMNSSDRAVYRWGLWGGRIAPVAMPQTAAAAVLAYLKAEGAQL